MPLSSEGPTELGPPAGLSGDPRETLKLSHHSAMATMHVARAPEKFATLPRWAVGLDEDPSREGALPGAPSGGMDYRLREVIGEGGFGEVRAAVQSSLGRIVAVKRIKAKLYEEPGLADLGPEELDANFRHEAVTTARLDHPNIVPVYDLGVDGQGRPLLAMKLARGESWERKIASEFDLPAGEFLARHLPILLAVSQAVAFAHSKGIVHRDIKPSQVRQDKFGEVYLMDWGLAIAFDENKSTDSGFDSQEVKLPQYVVSNPAGTPAFMAPEQTEADINGIGTWTDVYLLGGTLYYLLTGHLPHEGTSSAVVYAKARAGDVEPVNRVAPSGREVPLGLADLAAAALRRERDKRCTLEEFIEGIQDYLTGAGNRRRSQELTRGLAARIEKARGDYGQLADCRNLHDQSFALWPGNPELPPIRQTLLEAFARSALRQRDMALARVAASMLAHGETKEDLAATIEEINEAGARRRMALWFAFATLAILFVLAAWQAVVSTRHDLRETAKASMARDAIVHLAGIEENGPVIQQLIANGYDDPAVAEAARNARPAAIAPRGVMGP